MVRDLNIDMSNKLKQGGMSTVGHKYANVPAALFLKSTHQSFTKPRLLLIRKDIGTRQAAGQGVSFWLTEQEC